MDFNNDQKYNLLSKMGYTGPAEGSAMEAFIQSSPGVAAKMGKFSKAIQKKASAAGMLPTTGMSTGGMATGGQVSGYAGGGLSVKTGGLGFNVVDSSGKVYYNTADQAAAQNYINKVNAGSPVSGNPPAPAATVPTTAQEKSSGTKLTEAVLQNPTALTVAPQVAQIGDTAGAIISSGAGQVGSTTAGSAQTGTTVSAAPVAPKATNTMTATTSAGQVADLVSGVKAQQGQITPQNLVEAAQQTESVVSQFEAAQGVGILMQNPMQREILEGEIISGSAVDATKVESVLSSIQAAEATPSKQATVQGQLEGLMAQFEQGETPAWAAGAMRNAQLMLAQRGLGASSIAGQAIIQAAMESALPIAQADAQTRAQFESQNLSNRQQVALFAAQQRAAFLQQDFDQSFQTRVLNAAKVSDIANMNFTAEQNIALENSRIVNTVNLQNLSNSQAMTLAKVAALSNLELTNLNNRQQAAVQNAQAFLQMDLTNLSNAQQTELFRAQSNVQALFTDQAAENAAKQFNAASKNQTDQFFADLANRVSMFNAEQTNAMTQFNAGETNAIAKFNAQIEAQRQQFNAQSSLVIAQANAQWRQTITTLNTTAQNEANMEMARTQNAMTAKALDEVWQKERDILAYAFTAEMSAQDRAQELLLADKKEAAAESAGKAAFWTKAIGTLIGIA